MNTWKQPTLVTPSQTAFLCIRNKQRENCTIEKARWQLKTYNDGNALMPLFLFKVFPFSEKRQITSIMSIY